MKLFYIQIKLAINLNAKQLNIVQDAMSMTGLPQDRIQRRGKSTRVSPGRLALTLGAWQTGSRE